MQAPTLILCACGCGASLPDRDARGRPKRFLHNHHTRLQPSQQETHPCQHCGAPVARAQWHLKRTHKVFCDAVCHGAWLRATDAVRGPNNPHSHSLTVPCAGCGTPVTKAHSLIMRRAGRVFCPACIPATRQGHRGFYEGYPKAFNKTLRARIRHRDGQTCQWCQRPQTEVGTLHVHHIDYCKDHCDPANLISLCVTCHGRTQFAQATWTKRLAALLRARGL